MFRPHSLRVSIALWPADLSAGCKPEVQGARGRVPDFAQEILLAWPL